MQPREAAICLASAVEAVLPISVARGLDKCVPFLRKFVSTLLFIGSFDAAVDLGAAEVEIQVVPRGVEPTQFDGVVPALMPEELLVDPNTAAAFDEINQRWVISVQPLERFLTEMTLEIERCP